MPSQTQLMASPVFTIRLASKIEANDLALREIPRTEIDCLVFTLLWDATATPCHVFVQKGGKWTIE